MFFVFVICLISLSNLPIDALQTQKAEALVTSQGDGILLYAASSNTTPQWRTYIDSTNTFSANSGTVVGAQPTITVIKTSPIKQEAIGAYQDTSGNLRVMCYDGTTWTEDWTVAVAAAGTPTTRRFDVAYETTSGDVTVAYSRNTAATNALAYRTKAGSSGCGSANWAGAANFPTGTAVTSATVQWVKAARNGVSSSNLQAWVWLDNAATNADLGAAIWDGSAFTNFKSIETSMEHVTAVGDTDNFDVQYESLSGDLMTVWGNSAGTASVNGAKYMTCTGGTSSCTWGAATAIPTLANDATNLDLSSDPLSDKMAFASVGNAGGANSADVQAAYWSGTAWTGYNDIDVTAELPTAGTKLITTGWLTNNGNTKWYISFDDATGTGLSWWLGVPGSTPTVQTDFVSTPSINDIRSRYDTDINPFDNSELIQTVSDSTNGIFAFKLSMNSSGTVSWSNSGNAASLGTKPSTPQQGFHFQYWRYIPPPITTLGNGTDGGSRIAGPGAPATEIDRFSLVTNVSTDTVTGLTVTLAPANAYKNIATVDIQTTGGVSKCSATPSSNTVLLTSCGISVTTGSTDYVIKITPKSHANMDSPSTGASYDTTATVTSLTLASGTYTGTDSGSGTVTIDNASPNNVSSPTVTPGNAQNVITWSDAFTVSDVIHNISAVQLAIDSSNHNVYAVNQADTSPYPQKIFVQAGGVGSFVDAGTPVAGTNWGGVAVYPTNHDVYAALVGGDIYKQTNGTGAFNALGQTSRSWLNMAIDTSNEDVYAVVNGGDIYKQTAGSGNFVGLGQSSLGWVGIAVNPVTHDVYATVNGGDIYKQTGGSGSFNALGQTSRSWRGITVDSTTNDVYATVSGGDIYKQTGGTGSFVAQSQTGPGGWYGIAVDSATQEVYGGGTNKTTYRSPLYLVLRSTSAVVDTPSEGTTYSAGNTIGASTVVCSSTNTTCTDTGLSNSTAYHYKVFTKDGNGNYSTGIVPTGSPATPQAVAPTVTTQSASSVLQSSATLNGNITNTGGANATVRGFAWGTNANLSGGDTATTTENGTFGTGAFTNSSLTLVCNTTYYSRAYATNSGGTSYGAISSSFTTSACSTTTLGDGTDGGNSTIAPSASATEIDRFSLVTSVGTDTVTGLTVQILPSTATTTIATVGIYDTGGALKCSATPSGSNNVALTSCGISVTTTPTDYVIKITPKTHANMPAVPGASYAVTATTTTITSTNSNSGTDTDSATIIIDNASPSDVSLFSGTAGDGIVSLSWINPSDSDFTTGGTVVILKHAGSGITQIPAEGTTYSVGNIIGGTDTVICVSSGSPPGSSCTDTNVSNGTSYYYKLFTEDSNGNYSAGIDILGNPKTPQGPTFEQSGYRVFASSTPDGTNWTSRSAPASRQWYAITYGDGLFVGVNGDSISAGVMTSPDGVTWTARTAAASKVWLSIAYGNGMFVATAQDGSIMSSSDGITWTSRTSPAAKSWRSVTFGNGLFVAVADNAATNGVMTSPDGINWTQQTVAQTVGWYGVTYGNGLFVAVGGGVSAATNQVMTSSNGISWATQTAPSGGWWSVAYGNGTFVAVGTSGVVMTSTDGTTWTSRTSAGGQRYRGVTFGNNLFVAVADTGDSSNHIMTSPDGITWTNRSGPSVSLISAAYGNGIFAIVGYGTSQVWTSGSALGMSLASMNSAATLSATDDTFKLRNLITVSNTTASALTKAFKLQYAAKSGTCDSGFSGETYVDIDSTTPISFDSNFLNQNNQTLLSTTTDPFASGNLVYETYSTRDIARLNTSISSSDDGIWGFPLKDNGAQSSTSYCIRAVRVATSTTAATGVELQAVLQPGVWTSVAYGNGTFVALSNDGIDNQVFTSTDGSSWTPRNAAVAKSWNAVIYANGQFVSVAGDALGTTDDVMTSADGVTWTSHNASQAGSWVALAYGNGKYVAVSNSLVGTTQDMYSTDGINWTNGGTMGAHSWQSIAYGNGQFVAVSTDGYITYSADAINWYGATAPEANMWTSVTFGNGTFVAVSNNGTHRVMTSPDGVTWSTQTAVVANSWNKITYGNGVFVAVSWDGTNQVMYSSDAVTWSSSTIDDAATDTWTAIGYGNGIFVAVSDSGTGNVLKTYSTDTLLNTYTYIPEIITAAGGTALSQVHYRWRNDFGNEASAGYITNEDSPVTNQVGIGDRLRLRFLVNNTSGSASNYNYRLETASSSCSAWIQVASTTIGNPHWVTDTSARISNGEPTTDSSGLTNPAGTFVPGYLMTQDSQTPALSLTSGQFTELEFSIRSTSNVSLNTTYCFRLTNAGATAGFTYSHQPQITITTSSINLHGGGGGNAGGELNGTGPTIGGGNNGGGTGTEGNGGGQGGGKSGGGTGGGGGGDTGYLFDAHLYALAKNLFLLTDLNFNFGYIFSLR